MNRLSLFDAPEEIQRNFASVQDALVHSGMVTHAGLSNQRLIYIYNNGGGFNWQGKAPDINPLISQVLISPGLIETAGIFFSEGEGFRWRLPDERTEVEVIINRAFADLIGEEGYVGGLIERGDDRFRIIGIVDNFVFNNYASAKIEPVIFYPTSYTSGAGTLFVRLKEGVRESDAIASVQQTLQRFVPGTVFEPQYMDEVFDRWFSDWRFTGKLAIIFAALAIFLSCMGLFGLSAFAAEQRTKEIGIRKVLGASAWDVICLLGRSFMQLLLIAFVIAIPIACYAGHVYLQSSDYRISLQWYIFAAAILLVFVIAMLTVSAQSFRAATANPVKAIKSE